MAGNKHLRMTIFTLFMVLLIDGISQAIIVPILANNLTEPGVNTLVNYMSMGERDFYYGLCIAVFFAMWFIGAPILSDMSDSIGRKKALAICLTGSAVGFVLTAAAFIYHAIWLVIVGRIIDGITTGSQPIAQASIIDSVPEENKARYIAYIICAVTLGYVIGPLMGGVMSDSNVVSWFRPATPLYAAAMLTIINLILLLFYYKETLLQKKVWTPSVRAVFTVFSSAFKDGNIRRLVIAFVFIQIGWTVYQFYTTAYFSQRYDLPAWQNSIFFMLMGVGLAIGLLSCGKIENRITEKRAVVFGYSAVTLGILLTIFVTSIYLSWVIVIPATIGLAIGYTFLLKTFSGHVSADRQGWVMGVANSVVALGAAIASFGSGIVAGFNIQLPLVIAVGLLVLGLGYFYISD